MVSPVFYYSIALFWLWFSIPYPSKDQPPADDYDYPSGDGAPYPDDDATPGVSLQESTAIEEGFHDDEVAHEDNDDVAIEEARHDDEDEDEEQQQVFSGEDADAGGDDVAKLTSSGSSIIERQVWLNSLAQPTAIESSLWVTFLRD